jgi:hypothetical protein
MVHLAEFGPVPARYMNDLGSPAFDKAKESSACIDDAGTEVPALWVCNTYLVIPIHDSTKSFDDEIEDNELLLPSRDGWRIIVYLA